MAKEFNFSKKTIYLHISQGMERLKTAFLPEGLQPPADGKPDGAWSAKGSGLYHYRKLPYPENLLWDMGIDLPPDQYPLLEERIESLDEKYRNVLFGKYRDKRTNKQMAEMFVYSAQTISKHCVQGMEVLRRMLVAETASPNTTQPTGDEQPTDNYEGTHPTGEPAAEKEVSPVAEPAKAWFDPIKPHVAITEHDFIRSYLTIRQRLDMEGTDTIWVDRSGRLAYRTTDPVTQDQILDLQAEMEDTAGYITNALFGDRKGDTWSVQILGVGIWKIDFPSQLYDFLRTKKENLISDNRVEWV